MAEQAQESLFSSSTVARLLVVGLVIVASLGLVAELVYAISPAERIEPWVALFSLSFEQNLPTWYASSLLLLAGVALASVARANLDRSTRYWWALALAFFYLSFDEMAEIHERLGGLVGGHGIFYFDWVIPAAAVVVVIGLIYLPFLGRLPAETRRRFIVAGSLYVGGALLLELPLGYVTERYGDQGLAYALIDFCEETLELAGASLFLVAVLQHREALDEH